jgi:NAD(P)-dependent dehydrogenase (short-subunit alcohol dehydrogenase family)
MAKVVLIIGASKGIGLEIAQVLHKNGAIVYGTSRNPQQAQLGTIEFLPLDVTNEHSIQRAIEHVIQKSGRIDVVINNAGYDLYGASEDTTLEELSAQMDTNFIGIVRVIQAVLPIMRLQNGGKIINISSIGGLVALPFNSAYSASKFALEGYSESLRYEVLPFNIFISLVEPGQVITDTLATSIRSTQYSTTYSAEQIAQRAREQGKKASLTPNQIAQTINTIIQANHPRLRYYVGAQTRIVTLLSRMMPQRLFERFIMSQFVNPLLTQPPSQPAKVAN